MSACGMNAMVQGGGGSPDQLDFDEVTSLIEETKALRSELQAAAAQYPEAKAVGWPFHSAFRAASGDVPTEEQRVLIEWRHRLADRNRRIGTYFTFHNRREILRLFPLLGFGSETNFGYGIRSSGCIESLSQELEVLERDLIQQGQQRTTGKPSVSQQAAARRKSLGLGGVGASVMAAVIAGVILTWLFYPENFNGFSKRIFGSGNIPPELAAENRSRAQSPPVAEPEDPKSSMEPGQPRTTSEPVSVTPKPGEANLAAKPDKSEVSPKSSQPDDTPTARSDRKSEESISVVSINQSGGITAGEVNIARSPPRRRISVQDEPEIAALLSGNPGRVSISAMINDSEAYRFAQDWYEVLTKAGWEV